MAVFLDDGGVLNDNARRAPQWRRLVGEYLVPRYGGSVAAWGDANEAAFPRYIETYRDRVARTRGRGYAEALADLDREWIRIMFGYVGVPSPGAAEEDRLIGQIIAWVTERVDAAILGAADAVRLLRARGTTLYTASGGDTRYLTGHLRGMGILDCFTRTYGTDLVGVPKTGPEFYEAIFADSGVRPDDAVVVDDSPEAVEWAASGGAGRVVLIGRDAASLREVPALLAGRA